MSKSTRSGGGVVDRWSGVEGQIKDAFSDPNGPAGDWLRSHPPRLSEDMAALHEARGQALLAQAHEWSMNAITHADNPHLTLLARGAYRDAADEFAKADLYRGGVGARILFDNALAQDRLGVVLPGVSRDEIAALAGAGTGDHVYVGAGVDGHLYDLVAGRRIGEARRIADRGEMSRSVTIAVNPTRAGLGPFAVEVGPVAGTPGLTAFVGRFPSDLSGGGGSRLVGLLSRLRGAGVERAYFYAPPSWAGLPGLDGPIPRETGVSRGAEMRSLFGRVGTIGDLLGRPGGAAWWARNGTTWRAQVDLSAGNLSTLDRYLRDHPTP